MVLGEEGANTNSTELFFLTLELLFLHQSLVALYALGVELRKAKERALAPAQAGRQASVGLLLFSDEAPFGFSFSPPF